MSESAVRRWTWPVLIFLIALSFRLIYLAQDRSSPFFEIRGIDAVDYDRMAHGFWLGTWPGHEPLARPPLYPFFLALVYRTVGDSAGAIKVLQAVLGALSCALVFVIAKRFADAPDNPQSTRPSDSRAGNGGSHLAWVAALICCAYGTSIYADAQLLPDSLETLLQVGLLLALVLAGERARRGSSTPLIWLPAGGLLALSILNRGGALLLIPLLVMWIVLSSRGAPVVSVHEEWAAPGARDHRRDAPPPPDRAPRTISVARGMELRRVAPAVAALLAPPILALALTAAHNAAYDASHAARAAGRGGSTVGNLVSGRFSPVATNSGINFRLGNDPALRDLNDTNAPAHFVVYEALLAEARRAAPESASAQDRALFRETLRRIVSEPAAFAALLDRKALELVNGTEVARNSNIYAHRRDSSLLRLLVWRNGLAFPAGLVLPFAAVGLLSVLPAWRRTFPLLALVAAQALFILIFFVTDRYRVPLIPFAAILAAVGVRDLARHIRRGVPWWRNVTGARNGGEIGEPARATGARIGDATGDSGPGTSLGVRLIMLVAALILCNLPVVRATDRIGAYEYTYLAEDRERRGDLDGAIAAAREAIRALPDSAPARHSLATLMRKKALAAGDPEAATEALAEFEEAVRLAPEFAAAHGGLGLTYLVMNRLDDAAKATADAIRLAPDVPVWRLNMGSILARKGRSDEALEAYDAALHIDPEFAPAWVAIGAVREFQGHFGEAAEAYRSALRLDPTSADTRSRLTRVERRTSEPQAAPRPSPR